MTTKALNPVQIIKDKLNDAAVKQMMVKIAPQGYPVDTHVITAVDQVVKNLKTSNNLVPASVVKAVYDAASLGLSFNPHQKEAYLVPFNCKVKKNPVIYGTMVTFIPGYKGLIKLCVNAGMKKMTPKVIYEKDIFEYSEEDGEVSYKYSPSFEKNRGKPLAVLTVAYMADGTKDVKILPYHKVLEIKSKAKSQSGPWDQYEEEMAMKTAIRRHCNFLPQALVDKNLSKAIHIDEMAEAGKPLFQIEDDLEMENIIDAEYKEAVDNMQNNEPQSTKPEVDPEKAVVVDDQEKSNMEKLIDLTGQSEEELSAIIEAEFSISNINKTTQKKMSEIVDFFVGSNA